MTKGLGGTECGLMPDFKPYGEEVQVGDSAHRAPCMEVSPTGCWDVGLPGT